MDFKKALTRQKRVLEIIAETADIDFDEAERRLVLHNLPMQDAEIDSLDFLDIFFSLDKEYSVKIPFEEWTKQWNEKNILVDEFGFGRFTLTSILASIQALREEKGLETEPA